MPETGDLLIHLHTLLETKGSCSSIELWVAVAQVKHSSDNFKQWFLMSGSLQKHEIVFHLRPDGRKRVYQVEVGALVWLKPLHADLDKGGCISCLHAWGPWVIEQLIGMHEFPGQMHLEGKVSMVEATVRGMTLGANREVDAELHQVWTSDGADLDVSHALVARGCCFSSLLCHTCDESHSAG